MRKPKPKLPKYRMAEIGGPMPYTMYSAGPEQEGGGHLVFHETWVDVVLKPDSAWKTAARAKRKDSNKLTRPDGTWNVWFVLSRALVLSKESIEAAEREIGPADTATEAGNHLRNAGKARAMAAEARLHAILEACVIGEEIPTEVASTNHSFVAWFEGQMAERLDANDHEFVEAVNGFVRAANNLQSGYPPDVLKFSRALREQASIAGEPPTKDSVRFALGRELLESQSKAEAILSPSKGEGVISRRRNVAADIIDPNTFTRLLKRTGFSWLPDGKTGPKRQKKSGNGNGVDAFDLLP